MPSALLAYLVFTAACAVAAGVWTTRYHVLDPHAPTETHDEC